MHQYMPLSSHDSVLSAGLEQFASILISFINHSITRALPAFAATKAKAKTHPR